MTLHWEEDESAHMDGNFILRADFMRESVYFEY